MSLYLDTSVVVAALTSEPHTVSVQAWLREQGATSLFISDWVVTEVSSALSFKVRTDQMSPQDRPTALRQFEALCAESFDVVPVQRRHFRLAADYGERMELALRAPDCLHLAICWELNLTLCTLDKRLAQAGPAVGVSVTIP